MKIAHLKSPYIDSLFCVIKAEKHYSLQNHDQTEASCARPGEFIVMDKHFYVMVFTRAEFKKAFGHQNLQHMEQL